MLLSGSESGLPAVGLGVLGRADEALLATARRFVKRAGAQEPVLLAMSTGRVSAHGLTIPRLNVSPLLVVGPTRWWIVDRHGERFHARGRTGNIIGTFIDGDGVTVGFSETQNATFNTGQMAAFYVKTIIDGVLAHARLSAANFAAVASGQPPLLLVGTHVGGQGTDLAYGEPCVVAVSGRGLCAMGAGSVLLQSADRLRAVQIGATTGPIESAALANLMNTLMMRRHADCLIRFVFDDAEATFSLAGDTPDRLQLDAAALIAAIQNPPAPPKAQPPAREVPPAREAPVSWVAPSAAGTTAAAPAQTPAIPVPAAPVPAVPVPAEARFCGHCGARREPSHVFCTACGKSFDG